METKINFKGEIYDVNLILKISWLFYDVELLDPTMALLLCPDPFWNAARVCYTGTTSRQLFASVYISQQVRRCEKSMKDYDRDE
jgi:hypothetical protein